MTTALHLHGDALALRLLRAPLGQGHDERWLQSLLFAHPELLPIEEVDPGAGQLIPLCRELALPSVSSLVYLDMLAVTARGRLALIECKLWRNPQVRREVVAQILEYAALLRRWTFSDLTAKLKANLRTTEQNPIFEAVRRQVPDIEEARLTDGVNRSLERGAFDLLVVGDGIRSDLAAITAHLNDHTGLASRLTLVEIQLWRSEGGDTLVVPHIPFRTQVVEHRVVVDQSGAPLPTAASVEAEADGEVDARPASTSRAPRDPEKAAAARGFWQRFIETARFDHPDQTPPRHGSPNTVRMDLPAPGRWLVAYREGQAVGIFARFREEAGRAAFDSLEAQLAAMRLETGLDLRAAHEKEQPFEASIRVARLVQPDDDDHALLAWLGDAANRLVSALRPRLKAMADPSG